MKKLTILFCIVAISIIHAYSVQAQWKQLDVGQAGQVWSIGVVDFDVFAGTFGGIYRSTDDGESWINVSNTFAECFAAKGSEIFAGTYQNGVVRSTDGGNTWTMTDSGMTREIRGVAIKGKYMFGGGAGMFRSTDDGASWALIENGLSYYQTFINSIALDGTKLLVATDAGVCVSTDDGNNWSTLVGTGQADQVTNCVAAYGSTILVGSPAGMLRSTDDGYSWSRPNVPSGIVFSVVIDSNYSYVGAESGVSLSIDSGDTWSSISNGLPDDQVLSIAMKDTNLFAATFNNGVFRSTDNGTSWTPATSGIITSEVNSMAGVGPDVYAVINYRSLFSSTDYGTTWIADTLLHSGAIISVTVIGQEVYAMTHGGIFVSSDNGETWNTINGGIMDTTYPSILVESGSNLIAACQDSGHVYLSSDDGASWENVGQDLPDLASLAVCGPNVIAGTHDGMYLSTDNGGTWINENDTLININALATVGTDVFAGRYFWPFPTSFSPPSPPGGVFRSTDAGLSWSQFNSGIPKNPPVYALVVHGEDVFAGLESVTNYPGVFYSSTTNHDNWINTGQRLPNLVSVNAIYTNDSSVFVGTDGAGVWRAPLSQVTTVKQLTMTPPTSVQLRQNYPNPFNPTTTIAYYITIRSHVTLMVYNVLGQKVETLVDAKENPGSYRVTFDASRLASGVYFYRLEAKNYTATKKLMVIK